MSFSNQSNLGSIEKRSTSKPKRKLKYLKPSFKKKISWSPLRSGGTNFKVTELVQQGQRLMVQKTTGGLLFALAFLMPGILMLFVGTPYTLSNDEPEAAMTLSTLGMMFSFGGWLLLGSHRSLIIDLEQGTYYRGKWQANLEDYQTQGLLKNAAALQILAEQVSATTTTHKSRLSRFYSYELNLVLNNTKRVNIMDHGNKAALEQDAYKLAHALGIPVLRYE